MTKNDATEAILSRERIRAALEHRESDRIPMIDTMFWPQTLERWEKEGLPKGADLTEFFGLDTLEHFFGIFDHTLQIPTEVIEETEDHIILRNQYGSVIKETREPCSPSVMLEPGVKDRTDWERVRDNLNISESRITQSDAFGTSVQLRNKGVFVTVETIEPLWFVLYNTMGFEHGLLKMALEPDLFADMIAAYTEFSIGMLELCFEKGFEADALWLHSDICYRGGMLFSPEDFRKLAKPHLVRYSEFCRKHKLFFWWHSDGYRL